MLAILELPNKPQKSGYRIDNFKAGGSPKGIALCDSLKLRFVGGRPSALRIRTEAKGQKLYGSQSTKKRYKSNLEAEPEQLKAAIGDRSFF